MRNQAHLATKLCTRFQRETFQRDPRPSAIQCACPGRRGTVIRIGSRGEVASQSELPAEEKSHPEPKRQKKVASRFEPAAEELDPEALHRVCCIKVEYIASIRRDDSDARAVVPRRHTHETAAKSFIQKHCTNCIGPGSGGITSCRVATMVARVVISREACSKY